MAATASPAARQWAPISARGLTILHESSSPADKRGVTPLFWAHVAPYGEVWLDMGRRLALHANTFTEAAHIDRIASL
jgi:hypothetical protein